ncbi:MAG: AAA family ATPase [Thermoplasmata archaeon]
MRIEEVYIDGYGALHDVKLELKEGLVCIHGLNEAGKTTLLAFVRSIFFGFSRALSKQTRTGPGRRTAPYDPVEGGQKGGYLVVAVDENGKTTRYRLERKKVAKVDGELEIHDLTNNRAYKGEDAERLVTLILKRMDATLFSNVFALGPDELHALESLDSEEIQGLLFTADAGVGSALVKEMQRIEAAQQGLYKPRAKKSRINRLQSELRVIRKSIRDARADLSTYERDRDRLHEISGSKQELEKQRDQKVAGVFRARQRQEARGHLAEITGWKGQAEPLRERQLPDGSAIQEETRLRTKLEELEKQLKRESSELERSQEALKSLQFDENDADAWPVLKRLQVSDLPALLAAKEQRDRFQEELNGLGNRYVSKKYRERFQEFVGKRRGLEDQLAEIKEELEDLQKQLDEETRLIRSRDVLHGAERALRIDLKDLETGKKTFQDRLEDADRDLQGALARLGPEWTEERLKSIPTDPVWITKIANQLPGDVAGIAPTGRGSLRILVVLGFVMMAAGGVGLMGIFDSLAAVVLLLSGLAVLLVGWNLLSGVSRQPAPQSLPREAADALRKYGMEGPVTRSDFHAIVTAVGSTKEALKKVQDAKERGRKEDSRWEKARQTTLEAARSLDLPEVEDLFFLQEEIRQAADRAKSAATQVKTLESQKDKKIKKRGFRQRELDELMQEISGILKSNECESEEAFEDLIQSGERIDELKGQLEQLRSQAETFRQFEEGFRTVQKKRKQKMPLREEIVTAFAQTVEVCEAAYDSRRRHTDLDEKIQEKEPIVDSLGENVKEAKEKLKTVYQSFVCGDHDSFRGAHEDAKRLQELESKIEAKQSLLKSLESRYPDLRSDVEATTPDEDEVLAASEEAVKEEFKRERDNLESGEKELHARLQRLDSSDQLGSLLAEEKRLKAELQQAKEEWAELRLVQLLLGKAREDYEKEHGPKILKRASEFLEGITNGRYKRILRSTEHDGYDLIEIGGRRIPAIPVTVSRGTLAQVYLCIRLAYTDVMQEHRRIPYILDDVLMDFDDVRLDNAAKVLIELAQGRQVVLLTHHGHVSESVRQVGGHISNFAGASLSP